MNLNKIKNYHDWLLKTNTIFYKKVIVYKFRAIIFFILGLISFILNLFKKNKKVDFYFLVGNEFDKTNMQEIAANLRKYGYSANIDHHNYVRDRIFDFSVGLVPWGVPYWLIPAYSVASYINTFSPKLVVFVENIAFESSILRHVYNIKTVHVAHGSIINDAHRSYIDFDYFFVFGDSSIKNMKNNENNFGNTKVIKTGCYHVDKLTKKKEINDNLINNSDFTLLFLSQWLNSRVASELRYSRTIILTYAKLNPSVNIKIKLHPLEDNKQINEWLEKTKELHNVVILPQSILLEEAIITSSISVSAWSNALIVSTWLGVPIISIDKTNIAINFLDEIDKYFPCVKTVNEFSDSVHLMKKKYSYYQTQCVAFSKYHFGDSDRAKNNIAENLLKITRHEDINSIDIKECRTWSEYEK